MRTILILTLAILMQNCMTSDDSKRTHKNTKENNDDMYVKLAAGQIEQSLKDKIILEKSFSDNGDWTIVFVDDTTNTEPVDLIKEYYTVERESLIKGDINNDNEEDFAIRSIWGPYMGTLFGLTWYIFIKSNDSWIPINNNFGGGKFSDIEDIKSFNKGLIETNLQLLDEETLWRNDSIIVQKYKYENGSIIKIE